MSVLSTLGWGPFFSAQLSEAEASSFRPARAVADRGPRLVVRSEDGEGLAVIPGRLRLAGEVPVVGDFVLLTACAPGGEPVVERVLARRSALARGAAGRATAQQVLAANVDRVLVVHGLDAPVNPARLARTLAAVHASGAEPVVVLNKADLCADPDGERALAEAAAPGVAVCVASAERGVGLEALRALVPPGCTAALLGPSGVGKSSLVNALLGTATQPTAAVREADRRGRHTTTGRWLVVLPGGGLLLDGPGIRELKLWDGEGIAPAFGDVGAIAGGCRFRDCRHQGEPGCAVAAAVEAGALPAARLETLHKLEREARALAARRSGPEAQAEKRRWKAISKAGREWTKAKRKGWGP
jgi:ribosome biogenesis GTPase